ncbi:hypothetical protein VKT23_008061 [Stygiomarasmius scandens]|uniref:PAS domain-containing protein n=1 Tax=Marasmiellus scandens TaxID=2682957 RepID=A0ABR1JK56_9AGAR
MDQDDVPCVSFIGIVDFSQEARWLYMTDSVSDLLGYEPHELRNRPSLELVHPDEAARVRQLHYDTIRQDKAACLVYLRMKHKDPYKGYILCGISRTVCHNVLVGSVSFASPGAKALHNASTAQEITVISPTPHNFEFRRWHDPSPMPMDPIPSALMPPSSPPSQHASPHPSNASTATSATYSPSTERSWLPPGPGGSAPREPRSPPSPSASVPSSTPTPSRNASSSPSPPSPTSPLGSSSRANVPVSTATTAPSHARGYVQPQPHRGTLYNNGRFPPSSTPSTYDPLPSQSFRTCFILDRFSLRSPILYSSNSLLISDPSPTGRSFYDFVSKPDEHIVREWIDVIKGWGVNERGQPSDGGFGFGRFNLVVEGRDSQGSGSTLSKTGSLSSGTARRERDLRDRERERHHPAAYDRHAHSAISGRYAHSSHSHSYRTARKSIVDRDREKDREGQSARDRSRSGGELDLTSGGEGEGSSPEPTVPLAASSPERERDGRIERIVEKEREVIPVDAIFSAHSDGLMVILRRAM